MSWRSAKRVVIVGGGAGGIELAVNLARQSALNVFLVDRVATHIWKPRLHEIAAGARRGMVDPMEYAGLAERWGFEFVQGELANVEPAAHRIQLVALADSDGNTVVGPRSISYDFLVLAIGGVTPDLGVEGVIEHAFRLDHTEDAEALFSRFSKSVLAAKVAGNEQTTNIAIVGTGLTGVELAAYLTTDAQPAAVAPRKALPGVHVTLAEAAEQFMPSMSEHVRAVVRRRLERMGVDIRTNCQIGKVGSDHVETGDGERIDARLTVWATGRVGPPVVERVEALDSNKKRQWRVRKTLQTLASDDIFALGDCSYIDAAPVPPTAQAASEQAGHLVDQLSRHAAGRAPEDFEYQDKGTLLSLGTAGAVGQIRGWCSRDIRVHGHLAAAAYRGLERQHEKIILGRARAAQRLLVELFSSARKPRIKVH